MPSISLKELSQLDVQLEVNIPCPTWKVSSKQEHELDYDPVLFAKKIANATANKAENQALKLNRFKKLTKQRNLDFKSHKTLKATEPPSKINTLTPYQVHLAQVMCSMIFFAVYNRVLMLF